jgi:hypothetical protein
MKLQQRNSGPRPSVDGLFWPAAVIIATLAAACYLVNYTGHLEAIDALACLLAAIAALVLILIKRGGPNG